MQGLAESQLYSATGWASLYGGSGSGKSSGDGWGDKSGVDDTGARNEGLHESDDDDDADDIFGNSDSDPDSSKNDVHWNAAGDSSTKTASGDDTMDSDLDQSNPSPKKATSSSSSVKSVKCDAHLL